MAEKGIVKSGKKNDLASNEEQMMKNMQSIEMKKKIEQKILASETEFLKTLRAYVDKDNQ